MALVWENVMNKNVDPLWPDVFGGLLFVVLVGGALTVHVLLPLMVYGLNVIGQTLSSSSNLISGTLFVAYICVSYKLYKRFIKKIYECGFELSRKI